MSIHSHFYILLCPLLSLFHSLASADGPQRFIKIDGTNSPDGRYVLAWGLADNSSINPSDKELQNELDFDLVENYIVDIKSGNIVSTIGSTYFAANDFGKNHGNITALWRDDSGALIVVEDGKWESMLVELVYVVNPEDEFEPMSDAIPLTQSIRRQIRQSLLKENPGEREAISSFAIAVTPKKWTGKETVQFETAAYVPKSEDAFDFVGEFLLTLPGPDPAVVANLGSRRDGPPPLPGAGPAELAEAEWFYAVNREQLGPLSSKAFLEKIGTGEITAETLVWKSGFDGWVAAGKVAELAEILGGKPAPKPGIIIAGGEFRGIRPGAPLDSLKEKFGDKLRKALLRTGEGDFEYYALHGDAGEETVRFFFSEETNKVHSAEAVSPLLRAENGIGVGSTVADLKKAYPDLEIHGSEIEGYTTATSGGTELKFNLDVRFGSYELSPEELASISPDTKVLSVYLF